jgi:hypothetical protein
MNIFHALYSGAVQHGASDAAAGHLCGRFRDQACPWSGAGFPDRFIGGGWD